MHPSRGLVPQREPLVPDSPAFPPICRSYQEGRCHFGDRCRRQHVGNVEQTELAATREREAKPSSRESRKQERNKLRIMKERIMKQYNICRYYQQGRCHYGDQCHLQHRDIDEKNLTLVI